MTLKFNPNATFDDNLESILALVQDPEVKEILRRNTKLVLDLRQANTQVNREKIIDELSSLITKRAENEAAK